MHPAPQNTGRLPGASRAIYELLQPTLGALVALLVVLTASGCQTPPHCELLGTCGGDLKAGLVDEASESEWVATTQDACMDQLQLPVVPVSLYQQPARPVGKKAPAPATADWCASLWQKADGTLRYQGYFPIIPIQNVVLTLKEREFEAHFLSFAPQKMVFPYECRASQGINESCPTLGRHIAAAIAAESNVYHTRCYDDPDGEGGCICEYDLRLFTSVPGTWGFDDGVVTFYDNSFAPSPPAPADYCLAGDKLEMTGHNGLWLFNRPNLRTLEFHRPTCNDGVQSHALGETGVDCGGQCPECVDLMCNDGIQNNGEEGVDCGRDGCKDFCGCFNGVQDPWEEGQDCGGPCSLLCSCKNGVQDEGNEEGVDCGGVCQARFNQGGPVPCP